MLAREIENVLAALTPSNRLACQVSLHTGLRIGDVLALRTADLAPRMSVTESKTGKRRCIGLPRWMLAQLRSTAGEIWVFPARSDQQRHRTRQAVYADVKRAAAAFRLPQNVAPHSFRKVYAVDLMEKYGNIEKVRRALNHSNKSITMIYAMADKLLQESGGKRRARRR